MRRDFVQRFKGDRVATFEGGARLRAQDVELEASASWTDWRNIQADLIDGYGFPTTANVGNGRILSIGVTTRWRPLHTSSSTRVSSNGARLSWTFLFRLNTWSV